MILFFICFLLICMLSFVFFFFKQKTAYEMRISDWSSDVCSSDLFKLLLVTAQRRGEGRAMTTGQLDLGERLWTIPGKIAKNGQPHVVPLSPQAVAIIEATPRIKGTAGLIFTTNGETPVSGHSRADRKSTRLNSSH